MRHLVFINATRTIIGIYATAALAAAAVATLGSATHTAVSVAAANVPDAAEPGWYLTADSMARPDAVVLNPKAMAQNIAAAFVAQVIEPYIEPTLPKRARWVREANLTEADITRAGSPTDRVKRVIQFDDWIGNCVLIPDVSIGALAAMTSATAAATVVAKEAEARADAQYALDEMSIAAVNIGEFWYANAALHFFNYPLGEGWVTGRGSSLGTAISRYKIVDVPAGWNLTKGFNNMRVRALGAA